MKGLQITGPISRISKILSSFLSPNPFHRHNHVFTNRNLPSLPSPYPRPSLRLPRSQYTQQPQPRDNSKAHSRPRLSSSTHPPSSNIKFPRQSHRSGLPSTQFRLQMASFPVPMEQVKQPALEKTALGAIISVKTLLQFLKKLGLTEILQVMVENVWVEGV